MLQPDAPKGDAIVLFSVIPLEIFSKIRQLKLMTTTPWWRKITGSDGHPVAMQPISAQEEHSWHSSRRRHFSVPATTRGS